MRTSQLVLLTLTTAAGSAVAGTPATAVVAPVRAQVPVIRFEGVPPDAVAAVQRDIEEAFTFALKENGWSDPVALAAEPLVVTVEKLPPGTMAAATGAGRFSISAEGLHSPSAIGVFAHELTHVQDFRAAGAGLGKIPRYLEEGRALAVGRALRALHHQPADDVARAQVLARLTAAQGKEALELFRDGAGFKQAKEKKLGGRVMSVAVFFIDFLRARGGKPDALPRFAKVWEKVGQGTPFDDAFTEVFEKPLASFEADFVQFLAKTENAPVERLKGTPYAAP